VFGVYCERKSSLAARIRSIYENEFGVCDENIRSQGQQMTKLTEAVAAKPIKWIIIIVTTGVLMALGSNLTNNYFSNNKIEQHNGK